MSQEAAVIQPSSRERHWAWREAHDRTKQCAFSPDGAEPWEDAWGQGQEIERLAGLYQRDVEDRGIVLANTCNEDVKVLPYFTRFSSQYYPQKAVELKRLVTFDTADLLTLTTDPRRRSCLFDAKTALLRGWAHLRNVMKKNVERNTGRVVGWTGRYLAVLEFQQSGNPHLHVILEGCRWIDVDWLRQLWESCYGVGTFVNVESVRNNRKKVINYLLKYLFKAKDNPRHLALLWALNARAYNRSHSIFNSSKSNCDKTGDLTGCEWFLVGVYPLDVCKDFKNRSDLLAFLAT